MCGSGWLYVLPIQCKNNILSAMSLAQSPQKNELPENPPEDCKALLKRIRRSYKLGLRKGLSSTRNNIHHYSSVIKKVLYEALRKNSLTDIEVHRTSQRLSKVTGLKSFVKAFWSPRVSNILRQSVDTGLFIRLFLETHIYDSNKCQGLKYLNRLFNSFHTGVLDRWVDTIEPEVMNNHSAILFYEAAVKAEAIEVKTQEPSEIVKHETIRENIMYCKQEYALLEELKARTSMCKEQYIGPYAGDFNYNIEFDVVQHYYNIEAQRLPTKLEQLKTNGQHFIGQVKSLPS